MKKDRFNPVTQNVNLQSSNSVITTGKNEAEENMVKAKAAGNNSVFANTN